VIALINHVVVLFFPKRLQDFLQRINRPPGYDGPPPFRGFFADWQTSIVIILVGSILLLEFFSLLLVDKNAGLLPDDLIGELTKINVIKRTNLVLIPAYNEEETIVEAIEVAKNAGRVLVIDDGSSDNTLNLSREYADHVISHTKNLGLAKGIMNGIDFALKNNYKTMVIFDADLQYTQHDLENVVKVLQNSNYDIIMGSRLTGSIEKMKITKRFGNWLFSKTLSYITEIPVSDGQTGLRAFTDVFASNISFRGQFTYTQEMIFETAKNEFVMGEIPIEFKERKAGESRLMSGAIDYAIRAWNLNIQIIAEYNPIKFSLGMMAFLILQSFIIINKQFDLAKISVLLFISFYTILFCLGIYAAIIINRLQLMSSTRNYKVFK